MIYKARDKEREGPVANPDLSSRECGTTGVDSGKGVGSKDTGTTQRVRTGRQAGRV